MEDQTPTKKRTKHPDRIHIEPSALEQLDRWIDQLTTNRKGVRINRKNIIHWLVESHADSLSSAEEKDLLSKFYDEELLLKDALKEIRAAKKKGETLKLQDFIPNLKPKVEKPIRAKRNPKPSPLNDDNALQNKDQ